MPVGGGGVGGTTTFWLEGGLIRRPHGHLHPPSWSEVSSQLVLWLTNVCEVVGRRILDLTVGSLYKHLENQAWGLGLRTSSPSPSQPQSFHL